MDAGGGCGSLVFLNAQRGDDVECRDPPWHYDPGVSVGIRARVKVRVVVRVRVEASVSVKIRVRGKGFG